MIWLVTCSAGLTASLFTLALWQYLYRERLAVLSRLNQWQRNTEQREEVYEKLNQPFADRVIRPFLRKMAGRMEKLMPSRKRAGLQHKLAMAGNPGNLSANEFLAIQYGLGLLAVVVALATIPWHWRLSAGLLLTALVAGLAVLGPEIYLRFRTQQRQEEMVKRLPDVLDLLTVSVEAGLAFDGALQKVIEKTDGVLAAEFGRLLQEIRMGKPRREALRDLADRTGVDDLTTFVGAMVQADQLGVSIGNVLRLQSEQMRRQRRQRAEEKAMKAPIKMLFPLVLFIFPTIFIVLLGPAVLQMLKVFGR